MRKSLDIAPGRSFSLTPDLENRDCNSCRQREDLVGGARLVIVLCIVGSSPGRSQRSRGAPARYTRSSGCAVGANRVGRRYDPGSQRETLSTAADRKMVLAPRIFSHIPTRGWEKSAVRAGITGFSYD